MLATRRGNMVGLESMKPEEMLSLEKQLCFQLYVTAKEIVNAYRPYLNPLNLTYTQYIVMMALWQYKDMSVKELGKVIQLDSGTLTPLLKKIEAKGYLKRKRSKKDERVVIVVLTEKGIALREDALCVPVQMTELAKNFTYDDAVELKRLLKKLQDSIEHLEEG